MDFPNNDYRLTKNAVVINAGNNAIWDYASTMNFGYGTITQDIAGMPRITGSAIDLGAYEYQGASSGSTGDTQSSGNIIIKGLITDFNFHPVPYALVGLINSKVATMSNPAQLLTSYNTISTINGTFTLSLPQEITLSSVALIFAKNSVAGPYIDQLFGSHINTTQDYIYTIAVVNVQPTINVIGTVNMLLKEYQQTVQVVSAGIPVTGDFILNVSPQQVSITTPDLVTQLMYGDVINATGPVITFSVAAATPYYEINLYEHVFNGPGYNSVNAVTGTHNVTLLLDSLTANNTTVTLDLTITNNGGPSPNNYVAQNLQSHIYYNTLQEALNAASPNAIIQIVTSSILEHDVIWPDKDDISIVGAPSYNVTWMVGTAGQRHLMQNNARHWMLKGIQFTYGRGDFGGVIQISTDSVSERLTIDSCTFQFPSANYGGVAYTSGPKSQIVVLNSTFNYCLAGMGGAFYQGNITVKNSVFNHSGYFMGAPNPSTAYGGLMAADTAQGFIKMYDSQIINNGSAGGSGGIGGHGGVFYLTTVELTNCVVTGSRAWFGGVFDNCDDVTLNGTSIIGSEVSQGGGVSWLSPMVAINSIFSNNQDTGGQPSGIFTNAADTLINCLVVTNSSSKAIWVNNKHLLLNTTVAQNFGPIYEASGVASFYAKNSILAGDFDAATASTNYSTVTFNNSIFTDSSIPIQICVTNNVSGFFLSDFKSDYSIVSSSVAIGAGSISLWNSASLNVTTDIAGNPRIVSNSIDIGAYEYTGPVYVASLNPAMITLNISDGSLPIAAAIVQVKTYKIRNDGGSDFVATMNLIADINGLVAFNTNITGNYFVETITTSKNYVGKMKEYVITSARNISETVTLLAAPFTISGKAYNEYAVAVSGVLVYAIPEAYANDIFNWYSTPSATDSSFYDVNEAVTNINGIYNLQVCSLNWGIYTDSSNGPPLPIRPSINIQGDYSGLNFMVNTNPSINGTIVKIKVSNETDAVVQNVRLEYYMYSIATNNNNQLITSNAKNTGADGIVSFNVFAAGNYFIKMFLLYDGYVSKTKYIVVDSDRMISHSVTVTPAPYSISGRIINDVGAGQQGIEVMSAPTHAVQAIIDWYADPNKKDTGYFNFAGAKTGFDGSYSLAVNANDWWVLCSVTDNASPITINTFVTVPPSVNLGDLVLDSNPGENSLSLKIGVQNNAGQPIAGAKASFRLMRATNYGSTFINYYYKNVDQNGLVTFNLSLTGNYQIEFICTSENYQGKFKDFVITGDRMVSESITLTAAPYAVTGRIIDNLGSALVSADVYGLPSANYATIMGWFNITGNKSDLPYYDCLAGASDMNGSYKLMGDTGSWTIMVAATTNDYPRVICNLDVPPSQNLGTYVYDNDPSSNRVVIRLNVKNENNNSLAGEVLHVSFQKMYSNDSFVWFQVTSDVSGRVTIDFSSTINYVVQIETSHKDYLKELMAYTITRDRFVSTDIFVKSAPFSISGKITDEYNNPTANVDITALVDSQFDYVASWARKQNSPTGNDVDFTFGTTTTDISGNYSLKVPTGSWAVLVQPKSSSAGILVISRSVNTPPNVSGLNFQMANFVTVNITGIVINRSNTPVNHVLVGLMKNQTGITINSIESVISNIRSSTGGSGTGTFSLSFKWVTNNEFNLMANKGKRTQQIVGDIEGGTITDTDEYMNTILRISPAQISTNINITLTIVEVTATLSGIITSEDIIVTRPLTITARTNFGVTNNYILDSMLSNMVIDTGNYELALATGNYNMEVYQTFRLGPDSYKDSIYNRAINLTSTGVTTYNIYITTPNTAPNLTINSTFYVSENQLLTITMSVLDIDGDVIRVTQYPWAWDTTQNYKVTGNGSFTYTFQTNYDHSGTYNLTFVASDGRPNGQTTQTVTVIINEINNYPQFAFLTNNFVISENQMLTFNLSITDTGDSFDLYISGLPSGATYNLGSSLFSWLPDKTQSGIYTITFTAVDTFSATVNRVFSIAVNDINGLSILSYTFKVPTNSNLMMLGLPIGDITRNMNLVYWDHNLYDYVTITGNIVKPGQAVWAKVTEDIFIDLSTKNFIVGNKSVSLNRGWNQLANPQVTTVNWDNLVISYNNETYSPIAAVSYNLIYMGAYLFNGTGYEEAGNLCLPWKGYWVAAVKPLDIIFPSKNVSINVNYVARLSAASQELVLGIKVLNTAQAQDSITLVGNDQNGKFVDNLSLPPFETKKLNIQAQKDGLNLMTCHQDFNKDKMEWNIRVENQDAGNLVLNLKELVNKTTEKYLYYLVDVKNNRTIMFVDGQATVYANGTVNDYKIQAINILSVGAISSLINYPNPFNPNVGESAKIEYVSSLSGTVIAKVRIYSILGKKLRTLDKTGTASDSLVWDGKDENGYMMPNDLYFYILTLTDTSGNEIKAKGKMVLWKK
ncbi:MAG: choice-of-anchor Q domain-containing protein [Candidatus Margulisbacteria bacterium]|nr:choice-of-anchor Q domain-containing protein [Candidatus Margulisiibacteriota bacterium]